jgi:insertion element IS1 protein InsB
MRAQSVDRHSSRKTAICTAANSIISARYADANLWLEDHIVSDKERRVIEHLLRERISRRGICRVVGVSLTWLLHYMVERFASCPDHLHVQLPEDPTDVVMQRLDAEADERWNFGGKKENKPWIWMAMDAKTRQVMAFHMGDRSGESGAQLWAKIPGVCQQQATFYTD